MIDGPFRKILPRAVSPLLRLFTLLKLTPNGVSLTALGLGALAALLCAKGYRYEAIGTWWLGRLLDGTDGIFARSSGQSSDFGAYLDIVCDMAAYSFMVLGFRVLHPELDAAWAIILFLYVLCIASALALGSLEAKYPDKSYDNRGLRLGAGLAEGGETGIAYTLFLVFPLALEWLTWFWIALLGLTVILRTLLARRILAMPK